MKHMFAIALLLILLVTGCSGSDTDNEDSVTTIASPGGKPDGVTVTDEGDVYITDIESGEVKQVTDEGETVIITDLGDQSHPDGLTSVIDGDSTILYISDSGSAGEDPETYSTDGSIKQVIIDEDGEVTTNEFVDSTVLENPTGIAVDDDGNVYVADQGSGDIYRISVNDGVAASPESISDMGTAEAGVSINEPHGVAVQTNTDGSITLYITDQGADSNNIVKIDIPASGDASAALISNVTPKNSGGKKEGTVETAEFNRPHGVAVDSNGAVFVTDENNNRVMIITPDGKVITLAGNGSAGDTDGDAEDAQFNSPRGVAVDDEGDILVCDYENGKVKKVKR